MSNVSRALPAPGRRRAAPGLAGRPWPAIRPERGTPRGPGSRPTPWHGGQGRVALTGEVWYELSLMASTNCTTTT